MAKKYDIFVSHSYADTEQAKKIAQSWTEFGYTVFADFLDEKLLEASKNEEMNAELSEHLRTKIRDSRVFVFLASSHAASSGWMPWELGLAHGAVGRVHVCYLDDSSASDFQAREYMKLYEKTSFRLADAKAYLSPFVCKARQEPIDPSTGDGAQIWGEDLMKAIRALDANQLQHLSAAFPALGLRSQDGTVKGTKQQGGSNTTFS